MPSAPVDQRRPYLPQLATLRFVAAFLVLGYHTGPGISAPRWAHDLFSNGTPAVEFFFVLSGFVLTYAATDDGRLRTSLRSFWFARYVRIYPAYAFALVVGLPGFAYTVVRTNQIDTSTFTSAVVLVPLLLQSWVPRVALAWNSPAWSLSVEAFLYAVFPGVIACLRRVPPIGSLAAAFLATALMDVVRGRALSWTGSIPFVSYFPPWFIPEFVFGIALGRLFLARTWSGRAAATLFVVGSATAFALFAFRSRLPAFLYSETILLPSYGALIVGTAAAAGPLLRMLSARPLVALGEASYALYILQAPIGFWWRMGTRAAGVTDLDRTGLIVAFWTVAVAASMATHRWFEMPLRSWLTRRRSSSTATRIDTPYALPAAD